MRIGIDASRANVPNRTGTEWYSYEVITRMVRQRPEHHFVLYLREQPLPDLANLGSHVTTKILRWPVHGLWNLVRLSIELFLHRPDVLFVPAHTIPLWHPRTTVTTLHDVGFERWAQLYSQKNIDSTGWLKTLINFVVKVRTLGRYSATELDYHRWSARFAVQKAAHIITISEFSKKEILSLYDIEPSRISVTQLGYNEAYQPGEKNDDAAVLSKHSIARPYIFFIGRLEEKKNIRRILESYALLVARNLPHDLVLAGKPGLGFAESYQALPPAIQKRIHLLGWVPQTEASALMRQAAVFFFPSLYEGFGLPVLEAFAAGTPVVTANENSLPEVAGDAALLVNPHDTAALADALQRLLLDPDLQEQYRAKGRTQLSLFSWDRCAQQTFAVLEKVAQG